MKSIPNVWDVTVRGLVSAMIGMSPVRDMLVPTAFIVISSREEEEEEEEEELVEESNFTVGNTTFGNVTAIIPSEIVAAKVVAPANCAAGELSLLLILIVNCFKIIL
tara:strand:- start:254 stop:574 length:321 start_codon:yes stop_codon:yes gene_type:complete